MVTLIKSTIINEIRTLLRTFKLYNKSNHRTRNVNYESSRINVSISLNLYGLYGISVHWVDRSYSQSYIKMFSNIFHIDSGFWGHVKDDFLLLCQVMVK